MTRYGKATAQIKQGTLTDLVSHTVAIDQAVTVVVALLGGARFNATRIQLASAIGGLIPNNT